MKLNETLTISVDITNDSYVKGKEVVQLYLRDHVAKVSRPVKELINFKKIDLAPNETKKVIFEITKKDLEYYDHNLNLRVDPGKFSLFIGPNSEELIEKEFILE
jgi:beta-glucosidase